MKAPAVPGQGLASYFLFFDLDVEGLVVLCLALLAADLHAASLLYTLVSPTL